MIDTTYQTVQALINKENRGYLTPAEFNLLAKQAQTEIFENYFHDYNDYIVQYRSRGGADEYGDMPHNIRERIDNFSQFGTLTSVRSGTPLADTNTFSVPPDLYRLMTVTTNGTNIEEETKMNINYMLKSPLTTPSATYPIYIRLNNDVVVYPTSITTGVSAFYIRKPATPKWTYININGVPTFASALADYQDFEIHPADEPELVVKILKYTGIIINEADVVEAALAMEVVDNQVEKN
ncbi:MAG: hypothetical protein K0U41_02150 [Gammaproteobacteria bacterium]|nr:hypothetical protein [Gammaproteobacteria bacterium]